MFSYPPPNHNVSFSCGIFSLQETPALSLFLWPCHFIWPTYNISPSLVKPWETFLTTNLLFLLLPPPPTCNDSWEQGVTCLEMFHVDSASLAIFVENDVTLLGHVLSPICFVDTHGVVLQPPSPVLSVLLHCLLQLPEEDQGAPFISGFSAHGYVIFSPQFPLCLFLSGRTQLSWWANQYISSQFSLQDKE